MIADEVLSGVDKQPKVVVSKEAVEKLAQEFVDLWNAGDIERACMAYAADGQYVSSKGSIRGRQNIINYYRERYPTQKEMGRLSLELTHYSDPGAVAPPGTMALATFKWTVRTRDGRVSTGEAHEVYGVSEGRVCIVQDITVPKVTH